MGLQVAMARIGTAVALAVNVMEKGQLVLSGAPKDVFQKVTFLKEKQLGVPKITEVDDFDCGIMISASHNPYYDNGIKLIDCYGEKMPEETLLLVVCC